MAEPQLENGYTQLANELIDAFCGHRFSGQEMQIIWVIIRKTYGYVNGSNKRKKTMDAIALSQFARLTGIDRRKCHLLLKRLVGKQVIRKDVPQKGDGLILSYGLQKDYSRWRVSSKKGTVTQMDDKVSPKKATKVSPKRSHTKENSKETLKENTGDHKKAVTYFCDRYQERFGIAYAFSDGKDGRLLKNLLTVFGYDKLIAIIDHFFETDDDFLCQAGYTIGTLKTKANTLAQQLSGRLPSDSGPEYEEEL